MVWMDHGFARGGWNGGREDEEMVLADISYVSSALRYRLSCLEPRLAFWPRYKASIVDFLRINIWVPQSVLYLSKEGGTRFCTCC